MPKTSSDGPTGGTSLSPVPIATGPLAANPFQSGPLPAGVVAPPAQTPTIASLAHALKRRWVMATVLGLVVAVMAAGVTLLFMPAGKHLARLQLLFSPTPGSTVEAHRSFKANLFETLRTRSLINKLLDDDKVKALPMIQQESFDKHRFVEESLDFKWVGEDTLRISMTGDRAEDMKVLLNLLNKHLKDSYSFRENSRRGSRIQMLTDSQKLLTTKVDDLRKQMMEHTRGQSGVAGGLNEGSPNQLQAYSKLEAEWVERLKNLEHKSGINVENMRQLDEELAKPSPTVPDEIVQKLLNQDIRVRRFIDAHGQRVEELNGMKKTLQPTAPPLKLAEKAVVEAEKELADAKTRIQPEVMSRAKEAYKTSLMDSRIQLEREANAIRTDDAITRERLIQLSGQLQGMMQRFVENQFILDKMKPLNEQLAKIGQEKLDLENAAALPVAGNAEDPRILADPAVIYENRNLKQQIIAASAAGIAGFFGILFLIAYFEWRTRRIDSVDQVFNELGMRVIGTIPAFPSKSAIASGSAEQNQNWRFILNESVNSTRTLLLHSAKNQAMQVIMVTSAMQGEGKTSLASQLATSMATAGLRTLILDCDMRNPSIHRLFDVALTPGCSEILCQEVDVSDAVQPTSVPNLWMIPGGQCSNRVVTALAQGHPLEALLNRLRGQFDFVIVDTCPVLPVADALLIGQHVDGVVFSILKDISQLPKVLDASKRLTSLNIPLLGAVVNGTKVDVYTYGYNYVKQLPA